MWDGFQRQLLLRWSAFLLCSRFWPNWWRLLWDLLSQIFWLGPFLLGIHGLAYFFSKLKYLKPPQLLKIAKSIGAVQKCAVTFTYNGAANVDLCGEQIKSRQGTNRRHQKEYGGARTFFCRLWATCMVNSKMTSRKVLIRRIRVCSPARFHCTLYSATVFQGKHAAAYTLNPERNR